jgi:hypothetical protein
MFLNAHTAIMPGVRNGNSNYRPKKPNANLSEEEDDDFVDEENEPTASVSDPSSNDSANNCPSIPIALQDPKKRKIFVVDGVPAVPPPKVRESTIYQNHV